MPLLTAANNGECPCLDSEFLPDLRTGAVRAASERALRSSTRDRTLSFLSPRSIRTARSDGVRTVPWTLQV